ncbi:MAG: DUF494 domain-containing protein [gamma proteobacterium symbiont of Bathyaustriella thionipta]|nr:DUF494 domain-containing protein [gamma proteobacterium symbiont of Bathyaustriella thionipta]
MHDNLVEILIYLYENYLFSENESLSPDQDMIRDELQMAGFNESEIKRAFNWLDELTCHPFYVASSDTRPSYSTRIYSTEEMQQLDIECRGLLMSLQQNGILDDACREMVIERALALSPESLLADDLKWIILLVLMNQPDNDEAFNRMQDMVYRVNTQSIH